MSIHVLKTGDYHIGWVELIYDDVPNKTTKVKKLWLNSEKAVENGVTFTTTDQDPREPERNIPTQSGFYKMLQPCFPDGHDVLLSLDDSGRWNSCYRPGGDWKVCNIADTMRIYSVKSLRKV